METWDLFDEHRQPLGLLQVRTDPMQVGQYHVVASVWTVNDHNEILITLRDPEKEEYPNYWENTAGSVLAGESSKHGAARELREETGILAEEEDLLFLGTRKERTAFIDTYIVRKNVPLQALRLQAHETISAQWVDLSTLDEMMNSGAVAAPVKERLIPLRESFEKFLFSTK